LNSSFLIYRGNLKESMKILKWKEFLREKIQLEEGDPSDVAGSKNAINELESDINQFNKFKGKITAIFSKHVPGQPESEKEIEKELSNLFKQINVQDLKSIKLFIDSMKSDDLGRIKFPNPLLGSFIKLSRKEAEVKKLEQEIVKLKSDMATDAKNNDSSTKEISQENIQGDLDRISKRSKKLDIWKNSLQKMKKDVMDKFNKMKIELRKNITDYNKEQELKKTFSTKDAQAQNSENEQPKK